MSDWGSRVRRGRWWYPTPVKGYVCAGRGRWRDRFRAVSYPYTDEAGMVVARVAEEGEYRGAIREGRRAVEPAWPAKKMEVVRPPEGGEQGSVLRP